VTANASSAAPWVFLGEGYSAGETSIEITPGAGTGVGFTLTSPGCTAVLGGTTSDRGFLLGDYQNSGGLLALQHSAYRLSIRVLSSTCSSNWFPGDAVVFYTTPVYPPLPVTGGFALSPIQTITSP
jgi:hypothetical protein